MHRARIPEGTIEILRVIKRSVLNPPQALHILFPNPLDKLARKYGTDKSSLGHDYTHYYFKFFEPIRFKVESILEIGVREGWSLKMWYDFFPSARIYGIDIERPGEDIAKTRERIKIFIGDQADERFLINNFSEVPLDIVIDDGGHRMSQQQISLKVLYRFLKPGGIYVIEDLHTSLDRFFWDADDYRATTLHILKSYKKNGVLDSPYFSEEDKKYFANNTRAVKIYRNKICFIEKNK